MRSVVSLFQKNILSKSELEKLSAIIEKAERNTSGEIRIAIRKKREWKEKNLSIADLAVKEFYRLGMQRTRDKTGVLIFLLLSEKKLYIAADETIDQMVDEGTWEKIADRMSKNFKEGNFFEGLSEAVQSVSEHLKKHFPRQPDDINELPNDIVQR